MDSHALPLFCPDAPVPGEYIDGSIGVLIGEHVPEQMVDDVLGDLQAMTGCGGALHPLGHVYDDMGTPHYSFIVHPRDLARFGGARMDTRWRGRLAWAREESACSPFPDEFVNFIF
jgi:hypothetical protein